MVQKLREGKPSIEVTPGSNRQLVIGVWMMEPGEDAIVGERSDPRATDPRPRASRLQPDGSITALLDLGARDSAACSGASRAT